MAADPLSVDEFMGAAAPATPPVRGVITRSPEGTTTTSTPKQNFYSVNVDGKTVLLPNEDVRGKPIDANTAVSAYKAGQLVSIKEFDSQEEAGRFLADRQSSSSSRSSSSSGDSSSRKTSSPAATSVSAATKDSVSADEFTGAGVLPQAYDDTGRPTSDPKYQIFGPDRKKHLQQQMDESVHRQTEGAKGAAGVVVRGMAGLGDLAIQGLTGLAESFGFTEETPHAPTAAGFEKGKAKAGDFVTNVLKLNEIPVSKEEEQLNKIVSMLPESIQKAGDAANAAALKAGKASGASDEVYIKFAAAVGASTQGLLTLLTLKPGTAARISQKGWEKVLAPKTRDVVGYEPNYDMSMAGKFDELAAQDPEKARAVADHIGKYSPHFAEYLYSQIDEVNMRSFEENVAAGEKAAEETRQAQMEHTPEEPPDQLLLGRDAPRGTPPKPPGPPMYVDSYGRTSTERRDLAEPVQIVEKLSEAQVEDPRQAKMPTMYVSKRGKTSPDPELAKTKTKTETIPKSIEKQQEETRALKAPTAAQTGANLREASRDLSATVTTLPVTLKNKGIEPRFLTNETVAGLAMRQVHQDMLPVWEQLNDLAGQGLGTDSHRVLNEIISAADSRNPIRELARSVLDRSPNIPVELYRDRLPGKYKTAAAVFAITNEGKAVIRVRSDVANLGEIATESIIHEQVHAATYNWIKAHPDHPLTKRLNTLFGIAHDLVPRVVEDLHNRGQLIGYDPKETYDYAAAKSGDAYGMQDAFEFIAEARSNVRFQRLLAETGKHMEKGLLKDLQKNFNSIAGKLVEMLGIKDPNSAALLHAIWDVTDRIMEEQKNWAKGDENLGYGDELPGRRLDDARDAIDRAFQLSVSAARKAPGIANLEGQMKVYWRDAIQHVNPRALGHEADLTAATVAKALSTFSIRESMYRGQAKERIAFWNRMPEADRWSFVKRFEKGENFADPIMQHVAEGYRSWANDIYQQDLRTGFAYTPVDHYLPHLYENVDEVELTAFLNGKFGAKWSEPGFVKDRGFDMYEQAIEEGKRREAAGEKNPFKPKYNNPEEIMLARQHASDIAEMRAGILEDLERFGLARKVPKPTFVERVTQKGTIVKEWTKPPKGEAPGGFLSTTRKSPTGDAYWVHKDAAVILRNAFDTKSLWAYEGVLGAGFRGAMALKNTIVPLRLAISLFHPLHVVGIDLAAGMSRATTGLLSGSITPTQWIKQMGKAGSIDLLPFAGNHKFGSNILRILHGKESVISQADAQALSLMMEGGFIPIMSEQYKTNAIKNFRTALADHSVKALFHAPFAALDWAFRVPLFEHWIPSLKIASYLKDAKEALMNDPTLYHDDAARRLRLNQIGRQVDGRYGEMAYKTMFMNPIIKDILVANTLSLGWQLGFLQQYGGGAKDILKLGTEKGTLPEKAALGKLDKPTFLMYYMIAGALLGGMMTYFLGKRMPESLLDLTHPLNGEKNPDGTDQRVKTMFYNSELMAIYKNMQAKGVGKGLQETISSKGSGLVGLVAETWDGVNALGVETRDPNSPIYWKVAQQVAYTLSGLEPISIRAIGENASDHPVKTSAMALAGFTPAPKYVTDTPTETAIKSAYSKYVAPKQTPYERAEYSLDAKKLKSYFKSEAPDAEEKYAAKLDEMTDKYSLSAADRKRLESNVASTVNPMIKMFTRLPWKEQKRILDRMDPAEREEFIPHSNKDHLRDKYEAPEEVQ